MAGAVQAFNPESTFVINDSTISGGLAPSFRARVADEQTLPQGSTISHSSSVELQLKCSTGVLI